MVLCYGKFQGCMCSDTCVEKKKKDNLIKLSFFFTWIVINVLHIYLRTVKIRWV